MYGTVGFGRTGSAAVLLCAAVCCAAYPCSAENLLANPGFEALDADGTPQSWNVFVQPGAGALGRISRESAAGNHSASLYNPTEYDTDPANNWSQVVYGDFGGTSLTATVLVRTEDVGGIALWIQCFQSSPARALAVGSSSDEFALAGTNDWSEVRAVVDAPLQTAFIVVRCVLQGAGRAWFDEATLAVAEGAALEVTEPVEETDLPDSDAMALQFEGIRQQMQTALDQLKASNEGLQRQIGELESEIASLREQLNAVAPAVRELKETADSTENQSGDEPAAGHILVPRDGETEQ